MAEVKWIKIASDIFDNDKIQLIEAMPEADSIITIWFKLLCLAGKQNNSGVFALSNGLAYTDEMFAAVFHRPLNIVRLALSTLKRFGMVDVIDDCVTIPNWEKYQSLDGYEAKKQRDRLYQADRRAKQKLLAEKSSDSRRQQAIPSSDVAISESEEESDIDISVSKDTDCQTKVRQVVEAWNALGLSQVEMVKSGSTRYTMLRKRIKDYGVETVIRAIENIKGSSFLQGQNKKGWMITFDWFIKPNNFVKVLENQYVDRYPASSGNTHYDYDSNGDDSL
jgi:predicted phage replisome organizer